jgi:hypothetical protein
MGSIWPSSPCKDIAEPAMAFLMHLEATIALSCTSSLPCGVAREGLTLAWRSCGVSCLRCLLMPSAHSFLPTPPRNTTTTTSKHHQIRSGRSQQHAQQAQDAAISIQVIMRPWCTSRAGGGEDFAALRSQGLNLPGQRKYTLQHANLLTSIAEKVGFAAFGVVVGAASIYTMVRLDRASGPAPTAAETATKSSTTVRLHTVGDYLVSTITHPYSSINMPSKEHY